MKHNLFKMYIVKNNNDFVHVWLSLWTVFRLLFSNSYWRCSVKRGGLSHIWGCRFQRQKRFSHWKSYLRTNQFWNGRHVAPQLLRSYRLLPVRTLCLLSAKLVPTHHSLLVQPMSGIATRECPPRRPGYLRQQDVPIHKTPPTTVILRSFTPPFYPSGVGYR